MKQLVLAAALVSLLVAPLSAGELYFKVWFTSCAGHCERVSAGLLRCALPPDLEFVFHLEARSSPGEWIEIDAFRLPGWARFSPVRGFGRAVANCTFVPPRDVPTTKVTFRARTQSGLTTSITLELSVTESPGTWPSPSKTEFHSPVPDEVFWEEGRRLTWDDFRGTPPSEPGGEAAEIAYEIRYRYAYEVVPAGNGFRARLVELRVELVMLRDRSWAYSWARIPEVLCHEQAHFDLAEVYRRLLADSLAGSAAKGGTPEEAISRLRELITEVFREIKARMDRAQSLYDAGTSHGRDAEAQREWEGNIARWLQELWSAP